MLVDKILLEAEKLKEELISIRRALHEYAETGFELTETKAFVWEQLVDMGYVPEKCGKSGIVACVGNNKGKTFLLRADMDALPIREEADVEYACTTGNMHACGHDMHTTMLLGAAKILKKYEYELEGNVKLMFQPAEELLEGSRDMISAGILENPSVDAGLMIHVLSGVPIESGTVIVSGPGISAPSADYFTIEIEGKGCHGSSPQDGVDAALVSSYILIGLQELLAREISIADRAIITIGSINAGEAHNVIAGTGILRGSMRTYDEELRKYLKRRIIEISENISNAYRAKATIIFDSGTPCLINDKNLSESIKGYLEDVVTVMGAKEKIAGGGSEDFAYISQKIPTIMVAIAAGNPASGYIYPLHHPKVKFDESVLTIGSVVYSWSAIKYLQEKISG